MIRIESEYQNEQVIGDPYWIVNDWTGHIKAMSGNRFVRAVRGNEYGSNAFVDNGDGTVTDIATGLMWSQDDNGEQIYWKEALAYAESATLAGYDDWRLPNIKELQSIADYSVDEIPVLNTNMFNLTDVTNIVDGIIEQANYPFYWSSTSNPIETYDNNVDGDAEEGMSGTIWAWILASGYNVDMGGYDLHGAGSIVFVSKTEENSGIEDSVPTMLRLVRDTEVTNGIDDSQSDAATLPNQFELAQNYPNPFNPSTTISFTLPSESNITLEIYNMAGQLTATLVDDKLSQGNHKVQWQAANMSSGIYFYKLTSGSSSQTKRMILLK